MKRNKTPYNKMIEQMPKTGALRNELALMKVFHSVLLCALFGTAHH
jgi:hypothetical protein